MKVSRRVAAGFSAIAVMLAIGIAGCGSGSSHSRLAEANHDIVEGVDYAASPARSVRGVRSCLTHAGVDIRTKTKSDWEFGFSGLLPADEVGFAELPSGGVMDLWLAASKPAAKHAASVANAHLTRSENGDHPNVVTAHGKGVVDIAVVPAPVMQSEAMVVYRCLESV